MTVLRPDGGAKAGVRPIAVEAPVAIEIDGLGYAVMMMTPSDLDAFAVGFMLTERLADAARDVVAIELFESVNGWILRISLAPAVRARIHDRVRHRTSDTSCGLCGIENLEQLRRPVHHRPPVPSMPPSAIFRALRTLRDHQPLNTKTGAVHAATACQTDGIIAGAFEDVGRHNALDKLVGWAASASYRIEGCVLVTSRISFEMVDKALIARTPILAGVSAPTTMAIDHANAHGLTLVALVRSDALLVVNDPHGVFAGDGATVVAEEGLEPPTPGL